jgi:hypothetical protein
MRISRWWSGEADMSKLFTQNAFSGGGSGGAIAVPDSHIFSDATARDAYFSATSAELIEGVYCVVEPDLLQQYRGGQWVAMSMVIRGPRGFQGIPGQAGTPGSKGEKGDPGEAAENAAHRIFYPSVDRTAYDFLHTPLGTLSAISEGDLITTSFTAEDIAQFGGMFSGALRRGHYFEYGSISGQLRLKLEYGGTQTFDPQTGPVSTYTVKISHIAFNGESDDGRVIYDGLRDGSGAINNLTNYAIPKANTFLNNADTFFMPDPYWFPNYDAIREFDAWKRIKITTAGTELDLADVYSKTSSGIATLSVIKAEAGDLNALAERVETLEQAAVADYSNAFSFNTSDFVITYSSATRIGVHVYLSIGFEITDPGLGGGSLGTAPIPDVTMPYPQRFLAFGDNGSMMGVHVYYNPSAGLST